MATPTAETVLDRIDARLRHLHNELVSHENRRNYRSVALVRDEIDQQLDERNKLTRDRTAA